jgi:hypothetical protein
VYTEHFIMHTIEKRSIIYNISWEDPRVERELLNLGVRRIKKKEETPLRV